MQVTQCPKCNGTFIINENEIAKDIDDYMLCFIDLQEMDRDDAFDYVMDMNDADYYTLCKDIGFLYEDISKFANAVNDGEVDITDNHVLRLIHRDNSKPKKLKKADSNKKRKAVEDAFKEVEIDMFAAK